MINPSAVMTAVVELVSRFRSVSVLLLAAVESLSGTAGTSSTSGTAGTSSSGTAGTSPSETVGTSSVVAGTSSPFGVVGTSSLVINIFNHCSFCWQCQQTYSEQPFVFFLAGDLDFQEWAHHL